MQLWIHFYDIYVHYTYDHQHIRTFVVCHDWITSSGPISELLFLSGGFAVYPNNNFYSALLCSVLSFFVSSSRAVIIILFNTSCIVKTVKLFIWSSIKSFVSASNMGKYPKRVWVGLSPLATFGLGCENFHACGNQHSVSQVSEHLLLCKIQMHWNIWRPFRNMCPPTGSHRIPPISPGIVRMPWVCICNYFRV